MLRALFGGTKVQSDGPSAADAIALFVGRAVGELDEARNRT